MARPRTNARQPPSPRLVAGILLAVVAVGILAAAAMRDADDARDRVLVPVDGFSDVHGLAASPDDPRVVYVATHDGLIRGQDGAWSRVGPVEDDLMGFTMHPTDGATFWTSGHPRAGGNMGVRQSTDGGFTWTTLWAQPVDFHAMTASPVEPSHLWGSYRGQLYQSTDGGRDWRVVNPQPPPIGTLAADARSADTLHATTAAGIATSHDGGRTWRVVAPLPALGLAVDPTDASVLYAGGTDALWKSTDGGASWTRLAAPAPGTYGHLAVSRSDPSTVYAATTATGIYRTSDSGATWVELKAPSR